MNKRATLRALIGVGLAGMPLLARAQAVAGNVPAPPGTRRLGVLMGYAENDAVAQVRLAAFREKLAALDWAEGRNLTVDVRWIAADTARAASFATELLALKPDVLLAGTTPATAALQRQTRTIPIVFASVSDPIGSGFVKTLARPGGNITGFINLEATLIEKSLQLLKEMAPRMQRAGVMFNPKTAPYADYYLQRADAVAPQLGVKVIRLPVDNPGDIEKAIGALGREAGSGLIAMTNSFMTVHRKQVIELAARLKVPAITAISAAVEEGGLISYGIDATDLYRRAAPYVDRILRGAKPADLPVQLPTLFELLVNLKTATALGLKIPHSILLRADRVIE